MKDLTISNIERQNVLNNRYAVEALQENLGFTGMLFEGEYRFTKKMVADFYEVDISTIDRYLTQYSDELKHNGYVLSKGILRRHYPHQVQGSKVYLPLSLSHKLPCYFVSIIVVQIFIHVKTYEQLLNLVFLNLGAGDHGSSSVFAFHLAFYEAVLP